MKKKRGSSKGSSLFRRGEENSFTLWHLDTIDFLIKKKKKNFKTFFSEINIQLGPVL
jgi:hypothetical protein